VKVEKKENYTLISSDENSFKEFYTSFLEAEKEFKSEHIIIQISDAFEIANKDLSLFLEIAAQKKENGTSFVIVSLEVDADNFPETFNIVPTLQEAEDIIEMEVIERELGF
jgi:ribosomal protein S4